MHEIRLLLLYKYVHIPHLDSSEIIFFLKHERFVLPCLTDISHENVYFVYYTNYIILRKKCIDKKAHKRQQLIALLRAIKYLKLE